MAQAMPMPRPFKLSALLGQKVFATKLWPYTQWHAHTHTHKYKLWALVKPSNMCVACGKQPAPQLGTGTGTGTWLIWLAPGQITLTGSAWQPSDDKWTLTAHTRTYTRLTTGQLHTLRIRNLLEHTSAASVCVALLTFLLARPSAIKPTC